MRIIDADALPSHKFLSPVYMARANSKTLTAMYQQGWNDAIDAIIDNAPTVDIDIVPLMQDIVANIPEIVDKAINLYIEERRRENETDTGNSK